MITSKKELQILFYKGRVKEAIQFLKSIRNAGKSVHKKFVGEYSYEDGVVEAYAKEGKLKVEMRTCPEQEVVRQIRHSINRAIRENKARVYIAGGNTAYAERYLSSKGYRVTKKMRDGKVCVIEKEIKAKLLTLPFVYDGACKGQVTIEDSLYSNYRKKALISTIENELREAPELVAQNDKESLILRLKKLGFKVKELEFQN